MKSNLVHSASIITLGVMLFGCNRGAPDARERGSARSKRHASTFVSERKPAVYARPSAQDVGIVPQNTTVRRSFRLVNLSSRDVSIDQIEVGCSCTVAKCTAKSVPSGGSVEIDVEFRSGAKSADHARNVTVRFSDAGIDPVQLLLRAKVRTPLTVSVNEVSTRCQTESDAPPSEFAIQNYSTTDWSSIVVSCDADWAKCVARRVPSAHKESIQVDDSLRETWLISVKFDTSTLSPGSYKTQLRIVPQSPGVEKYSEFIPIYLEVIPPLRLMPESLIFLSSDDVDHMISKSLVCQVSNPEVAKQRVNVEFSMEDGRDFPAKVKSIRPITRGWRIDFCADLRMVRLPCFGTASLISENGKVIASVPVQAIAIQ